MKKIFSAALLFSCMGMMANGPLDFYTKPIVKPGIGANSLFERNSAERGFLKINKSKFSASGTDWEEAEVTGSGLFIHLGVFFPPAAYMNPYGFEQEWGPGLDFEFGSYFRFAKFQDGLMGLGLRVSWLSLSYTAFKEDNDKWRLLQISPVRVGPQFGFALNETMGVDAFYQVGFNISEEFGSIDNPVEDKNIGYSSTFLGLSQEIGAAFHYKVFCLGLGYRFGSGVQVVEVYDGDQTEAEFLDDGLYSTSNFHVTFGFKF